MVSPPRFTEDHCSSCGPSPGETPARNGTLATISRRHILHNTVLIPEGESYNTGQPTPGAPSRERDPDGNDVEAADERPEISGVVLGPQERGQRLGAKRHKPDWLRPRVFLLRENGCADRTPGARHTKPMASNPTLRSTRRCHERCQLARYSCYTPGGRLRTTLDAYGCIFVALFCTPVLEGAAFLFANLACSRIFSCSFSR